MSIKIIPSDLAPTKRELDQRLAKLLPISRDIHIDLMDGRFVSTKSVSIDKLPDFRRFTNRTFEAHLMMKEPLRYIIPLIDKGVRRIIVHYEALHAEDTASVAKFIRHNGARAILALNPETPLRGIAQHARHFDAVMLMGVHPGHNGAPYDKQTPARVRILTKALHGTKIPVQIDGGMTPDTIGAVVRAGATRIVSGSFISSATQPKEALKQLQAAARQR